MAQPPRLSTITSVINDFIRCEVSISGALESVGPSGACRPLVLFAGYEFDLFVGCLCAQGQAALQERGAVAQVQDAGLLAIGRDKVRTILVRRGCRPGAS